MSKATRMIVDRNNRRKKRRDMAEIISLSIILIAGLMFPICQRICASDKDTYINQEYVDYVYEICAEKNLCPELVIAIIEAESGGRQNVVSSAGCIGLMQLNPMYFDGNLYDWQVNINKGTDFLLYLFEKYGDPTTVLTAYNCGEYSNATKNSISTGYGNGYARRILKRTEELERVRESRQ